MIPRIFIDKIKYKHKDLNVSIDYLSKINIVISYKLGYL